MLLWPHGKVGGSCGSSAVLRVSTSELLPLRGFSGSRMRLLRWLDSLSLAPWGLRLPSHPSPPPLLRHKLFAALQWHLRGFLLVWESGLGLVVAVPQAAQGGEPLTGFLL